MKVRIKDEAALARLSLLDVRAYLGAKGWSVIRPHGRYASMFGHPVHPNAELLLPLSETIGDYAERLGDLVRLLAEVEDRSELNVFTDLVKSGYDVLRFHAPDADLAGTIELDAGVALYTHAREVVSAAAQAAIKPKRVFRGQSPAEAREYLDSLRLGQTEVGSYVLTILSPVPPALKIEPDLFGDVGPDPFARKVTRTMALALQATKSAAAQAAATGKLDPFEFTMSSGVSANLCAAVARLVEEGDGVNIAVTWSLGRPVKGLPTSFSFTVDDARVLQEAATAFREREPQSDITVEGFVVGLDRDHDRFDGRVRVRGFVSGEVKTISARFLVSDYSRLVAAHDRKLRVRFDGDLLRRGTELENPRNLEIFNEDDATPLFTKSDRKEDAS